MIAELGLRVRADGARQAAGDLDRVSTSARRVEAAARPMIQQTTAVGSSMSRMGPQVQNASFQIADFAVQVGAGTSATRAFAQQAPQLLGAFGAMGAVLGAVVAVGAGLAPMFMNWVNSSEDAASAIDDLKEAVDAYENAVELAFAPTDELIERFVSMASEARTAFRFIAESRLEEALSTQRTALSAIQSELADATQALTDYENAAARLAQFEAMGAGADIISTQRATVEQYRFFLDDMLGTLDLTVEQAQNLRDAIDAIEPGTANAGTAAAQLLTYLQDIYGSVGGIPDELEAAAVTLAETTAEAARLQGNIDAAREAAEEIAETDIAAGIGAGADEAARLANNLGAAVAQAAAVAQQMAAAMQGATAAAGAPNQGQIDATRASITDYLDRVAETGTGAAIPLVSASGGGGGRSGGGGGVSEAQQEHNERLREAERIFNDTRTAAEEYSREIADLNELQQMGYLDTDTYARAVRQLNEEFANSQHEELRQGIESISDSIADAIVDSENMGEAFREVLRQMASDILSSGIRDLLTETLIPKGPSGGGFLANAIGSLFGSRNAKGNAFLHGEVTAFARGGIVDKPTLFPMARGAGLMGEAGPEAVMPLKRGQDGKLGVEAQQPVTRVEVMPSPYFDVTVDGRAQQVAMAGDAQVARGIHRSNGQRMQNYSLRGTN